MQQCQNVKLMAAARKRSAAASIAVTSLDSLYGATGPACMSCLCPHYFLHLPLLPAAAADLKLLTSLPAGVPLHSSYCLLVQGPSAVWHRHLQPLEGVYDAAARQYAACQRNAS
jgi:hypothetical protein